MDFDEVARAIERDPAACRQLASRARSHVREGRIDGLPGFVTVESDGVWQTTALAIEEGRIATLYITRNPDKLRAILRGMREDVPS